jgi:TolA-binding protein
MIPAPGKGFLPLRRFATMPSLGLRGCGHYIFVVLLFLFAVYGCAPKGDKEAFEAAESLLSVADFRGAIKGYNELLGDFPDSAFAPESQFRIGYIYHRHLDDWPSAKKAFDILFELYPDSPESALAREEMAAYYSSSGEHKSAIAEYAALIDKGPADKEDLYRFSMAMEYIKLWDFHQARIELEDLLEKIPSTAFSPGTHLLIADLHYLEGNLHSAIKAYDKVIKDYPELALSAKISKTTALEEAGRPAEALSLLKEIRRENPGALKTRVESSIERLKRGFGLI